MENELNSDGHCTICLCVSVSADGRQCGFDLFLVCDEGDFVPPA